MRIANFKFEVCANIAVDEFKDERESGKGINAGAHLNLELGEAEVTPEESIELVHSAMDLIKSEMDKQIRYDGKRKEDNNRHIEDLRKELDKKEEEVKMLRGAVETQRVELSYLKGKMDQ